VRLWLVLIAASACGSPAGAPLPDAAPPFGWTVDLADHEEALLAVWTGAGETIAVGGDDGRGVALAWDGGDTWRELALPDGTEVLWWVWGAPGGDVYAVGDGATVLARKDGVWRREPTDSPAGISFFGVWGSADDDVWVVGGDLAPTGPPAAILHWNGLAWSSVDTRDLPARTLYKVWGGWAVGAGGTILRLDGGTWVSAESPTTARLISLIGRGPDDIYAVGGDATGEVLRWDGERWTAYSSTLEPLSAVWTAPGLPLYAGGLNGSLTRFPDGAVAHLPGIDVHTLTGDATRVIAAGADLQQGGTGRWRGTLATHGPRAPSDVVWLPPVDAGIDAGPRQDAAPGLGEGAVCDETAPCRSDLTCWYFERQDAWRCTTDCADPSTCTAYGEGACCVVPGRQTTRTVCTPADFTECQ
jgi:hypothetical protein